MNHLLIVGTVDGLLVCEREPGGWRVARRALERQTVSGLTCQRGRLLAATPGGIFSSDTQGQTWCEASTGLTERYVRQIAFHPDAEGLALAGTEPAAIFITRDGGETWCECPEVTQLRVAHGWFLPYSPGAGCVRAFSFHGPRAYAAAEIGGLLRSDDFGATWRLVPGSTGNPDFNAPVPRTRLHPDVHDVVALGESPDVLYAATMRGLYRSADGGARWLHIYADCYVRAVWADPQDPGRLILGPADDVSVNGQIEETHDAGFTWALASEGLAVPWRRALVERFVQVGDELLAILSDGRLFAAPLDTLHWRQLFADLPAVIAVAALPA
jgi:photosystem II stability/assembly factor-like uncharacterized protein